MTRSCAEESAFALEVRVAALNCCVRATFFEALAGPHPESIAYQLARVRVTVHYGVIYLLLHIEVVDFLHGTYVVLLFLQLFFHLLVL